MTEESDEPEEVPLVEGELRDQLQAAGCTGPVWDRVAVELVRYGLSVMSAWLSTRLISQKCREKGRGVNLPDDWSLEDREDLVSMSVANGVEMFRQALLADRWKPEKGASLRTYFVGSCVLAFPNVLRQWQGDRQRYQQAAAACARETAAGPPGIEPVDVVDALEALRSLTRDESKRDQAMRYLRFHDFTPAQIAEILGITPSAATTALARMHRRGLGESGRRKR